MTIRIGISTCPNDTFAFHALLHRTVDTEGLAFEFTLTDVEVLNRRLFAGDFDVAKASFAAALQLADQVIVLPSGSALGFGVGPVLIGRPGSAPLEAPDIRVLGPGEHTTATLLFRIFHGGKPIRQVVFSEIFSALERGEADYGICIHEGRFTYADRGLRLIDDLGERWEQATQQPLPLGGIVARRSLPDSVRAAVARCIRRSIEFARRDPDAPLPTMRRYAQEFDDAVLGQHVELYVNDATLDLSGSGVAALRELGRRAREAGVVTSAVDLEVMPWEESP